VITGSRLHPALTPAFTTAETHTHTHRKRAHENVYSRRKANDGAVKVCRTRRGPGRRRADSL